MRDPLSISNVEEYLGDAQTVGPYLCVKEISVFATSKFNTRGGFDETWEEKNLTATKVWSERKPRFFSSHKKNYMYVCGCDHITPPYYGDT